MRLGDSSHLIDGDIVQMNERIFTDCVLDACDRFRLDPTLPEIAAMIDDAQIFIDEGNCHPHWIHRALNPETNIVREADGSITVPPRDIEIFYPLTLVRHCYPDLQRQLSKLTVDAQGLRLWEGNKLLAKQQSLAIDPTADNLQAEFAYVDACIAIGELTGRQLDYQKHYRRTTSITAERSNSRWQFSFQRPAGHLRLIVSN